MGSGRGSIHFVAPLSLGPCWRTIIVEASKAWAGATRPGFAVNAALTGGELPCFLAELSLLFGSQSPSWSWGSRCR